MTKKLQCALFTLASCEYGDTHRLGMLGDKASSEIARGRADRHSGRDQALESRLKRPVPRARSAAVITHSTLPQNLRTQYSGWSITGGIVTVVHQTRIHHTEQQFTFYYLTYGTDETVQSVQKESRSDASDEGEAQD
jgi:hypothetical protein